MYDLLRRWALAILKAPPEPQPPVGDPASLRVFRAGQNYLRLRLGRWVFAELAALAGLVFWTAFLISIDGMAREERAARAKQKAAAPASQPAKTRGQTNASPGAKDQALEELLKEATGTGEITNIEVGEIKNVKVGEIIREAAEKAKKSAASKRNKNRIRGWAGIKRALVEAALYVPAGGFTLIWVLKIAGIVIYFVQIPVTYTARRLDYEMRWYMVTDRSLRLRHGVWKISESTMSFANIQQVVVSQGPLQRLLGLADVKVKSAGGGGGSGDSHSGIAADMHAGFFHGVTNATEIRDLILERLRRFREAGLGDPDEKPHIDSALATSGAFSSDTVAAARELATEARALRAALSSALKASASPISPG